MKAQLVDINVNTRFAQRMDITITALATPKIAAVSGNSTHAGRSLSH
jgi:hypothetical protein